MHRFAVPAAILALAACAPEAAAPRENADAPALPADEPTEPAPAAAEPAETPPAAPPVVEASQTQCAPGENHLYSCPMRGGAVVSVCVGNRQVAYRYGPLGDPELDLTVRQGDPGVWQGGVVGQGGGQQSHLRFRTGAYDYIVFSGYAGSLADDPTRRWSGVLVLRDGRQVSRIDCPVQSSQTEIPTSMIPDYIPQETDESFNAWW